MFRGTPGAKYRPSNGTEGDIFQENFCRHCVHDKNQSCNILARSYCYQIDEPEFPVEWVYDDKGEPTCTAYE